MYKSNKRLKLGLKINIEIGTIKQRPRLKNQRDQIQNKTKLSGKETERLTLVFQITQKRHHTATRLKLEGKTLMAESPCPQPKGSLSLPE